MMYLLLFFIFIILLILKTYFLMKEFVLELNKQFTIFN
jgi:hypothetical protein